MSLGAGIPNQSQQDALNAAGSTPVAVPDSAGSLSGGIGGMNSGLPDFTQFDTGKYAITSAKGGARKSDWRALVANLASGAIAFDPIGTSPSSVLQNDVITGWTKTGATFDPIATHEARGKPEFTGPGVAPQFASSGEATPGAYGAGKYLAQFAASDEHVVSARQAELVNAGLLAPDTYRVGDGTDKGTMSAMVTLMRTAQLKGMSVDEAMQYLLKHPDPNSPLNQARKAAGQAQDNMQKAAINQYESQLYNNYFQTWGAPPPPNYVQRAMKAGVNVFEFEANERAKPAFQHSPTYQMERLQLEHSIASELGRLG